MTDHPPCEPAPQTSSWKRFRQILLMTIAAGGMLAILAWIGTANRPLIETILKQGPACLPLATAIFLLVLESVNLSFRWNLLLRAAGIFIPFTSVYRMTAGAIMASIIAPGANGGDALKLAYVMTATSKRTAAVATVVADRLAGLVGLFLLGLLAGLIAWPRANPPVHLMTVVSGLAVGAAMIAVFLVDFTRLKPIVHGLGSLHSKLKPIVAQLHLTAIELKNHPFAMLGSVGLSTLGHASNIGAFYFVSQALHITADDPLLYLVIVPFVFLSSAIPLPFGAVGVTEGIADQLFRLVAINGGGIAMLGYRFAFLAAIPFIAVLMFLMGGSRRAPREPAPADNHEPA